MVDSRAGSMSVPIRALRCPLLRRSLAVDDNLIAGNAMNETREERRSGRFAVSFSPLLLWLRAGSSEADALSRTTRHTLDDQHTMRCVNKQTGEETDRRGKQKRGDRSEGRAAADDDSSGAQERNVRGSHGRRALCCRRMNRSQSAQLVVVVSRTAESGTAAGARISNGASCCCSRRRCRFCCLAGVGGTG